MLFSATERVAFPRRSGPPRMHRDSIARVDGAAPSPKASPQDPPGMLYVATPPAEVVVMLQIQSTDPQPLRPDIAVVILG